MSEETLFHEALAKAPEERAAFLDAACAQDAELRARIEALLAAHDGKDSLLDKPALAATGEYVPAGERGGGSPPRGDTITEGPGSRIGPYKLLQKLGEGGMGAVFLAEQEKPVQRRVALKIIKAGMDSRHVLVRFEAERQALAMMDHPNIAKVLDAGATPDGRPYFIMELVKGIPITKYCDQEHLTPKERLDLFIPVCQAVQHAHQKGIIHRDIKPSNVIVALYDGRPVPKVIDFGVAKATQQKLTEKTMFTEVGQIVGTLEYMAPEQAELNNLDIDTRADIYSLGVLLYELLTGTPPFTSEQLRSAGFIEMLRMIREVEPHKPSTRLSSSAELPSIAARRKLEPKRLTRLIQGDLDWIIMKALEKDRGRRYDTANALAWDIQRYLNLEPVLAGPPSVGYRVRKFVRRNRAMVIAATVFLLALIGGIIGTSLGFWHADQARRDEAEQRKVAVEERDRAERERDEKEKARKAEAEQRQEAMKERDRADKERDQAERYLMAGLLRPLGYNQKTYDPAELIALEHLASLPEARLKHIFLEEALRDPDVAVRFLRRLPEATQAAVGASPSRRQRALALAAKVQRDPQADIRCKAAACFLTLELGSSDVPALAEAIKDLAQRRELQHVSWSAYLPWITQGSLVSTIDALVAVLGREKDSDTLRAAAEGLVACVGKLDAARAQPHLVTWCEALVALLGREKDSDTLRAAAEGLVACVGKLDAARAQPHLVTWCEALVALLGREKDYGTLRAAAAVLAVCVGKLDAATGQPLLVQGCEALVARLGREKNNGTLRAAAEGLVACVGKLDAATAQPHLVKGCEALVALLGREKDYGTLQAAAEGLAACVGKLDAARAQPHLVTWCEALVALLGREKEYWTLRAAATGLAACVGKLDAATGQPLLVQGCEALVARLGREKEYWTLRAAADGLVACVGKLDAATGQPLLVKWCEALVALLGREKDPDTLRAAADGLVACVGKLDAATGQPLLVQGCEALVARLGREKDSDTLRAAAEGLVACVGKLDAARAQPHLVTWCEALVALLGREKEYWTLRAAAAGLAACVGKLDAATAQPLLVKGCEALVALLGREKDYGTLYAAAEGLVACVGKLDAATGQPLLVQGCEALVALLGREKDSGTLLAAAAVLAVCVGKLDAATAQPLLVKGCEALVALLGREKNFWTLEAAAKGLAACVEKLDAKDSRTMALSGLQTMVVQTVKQGWMKTDDNGSSTDMPNEFLPDLLRHICDRRQLASYLKHSACAREIRPMLLWRLEELCYPPTAAEVQTTSAVALLNLFPGAMGLPGMMHEAGLAAHRYQTRHFRTVWDAVAWFDAHEPGLDWDSPWKP